MIRSQLAAIPIAQTVLKGTDDVTITRADVLSYLETLAGQEFSTRGLWIAFVEWMACFFAERVMKQEIAEIVLRRARVLDPVPGRPS